MKKIALTLSLVCAATAASAQDFPSRAMRWVVPSAAGDGSDIVGRLIADKVSRALQQPVVVENRAGAGGVVGSENVARSSPDGYSMIIGNAGSHGINAAIYHKLSYDVVRDFQPVALICQTPNVMVVNPKVPAKSVADFVRYAKAQEGRLDYASGGIGSSAHLSAELFKSLTGVKMTHVPYKGTAPAVSAVLSGEVDVMIGNLPPWRAHIASGRVQALAVTTAQRTASLPEVPTVQETLKGFETVAWFGVLAPAGTPAEVVTRVNAAVNAAVALPDVRERLDQMGCEPATGTPDAFAQRIAQDVKRWKKLATDNNIRAD